MKQSLYSVLALILALHFGVEKVRAQPMNTAWHPQLTPIPLNETPTAVRIRAGGQFGGPLSLAFPVSQECETDPQYGFRAFAQIMNLWNAHRYDEAEAGFKGFLKAYPGSPWALEAHLHLGCKAHYQGRYTEAEQVFRQILTQTAGDPYSGARELHGKALTRLSNVAIAQGNLSQAKTWLKDLRFHGPTWRERVYAAHWIQRVSFLAKHPFRVNRCGVRALRALLKKKGVTPRSNLPTPLDPRGFHIGELVRMAEQEGMCLLPQVISPEDLASLACPLILYLPPGTDGSAGHFWLMESVQQDTFTLHDPHTGRRFEQTLESLCTQWKGVILREQDALESPMHVLGEREASSSFGGCCGIPAPEGDQGNPCEMLYSFLFGAPDWQVNPININLYVTDVPIWYDPAYGPPIRFRFSYNSLSTTSYHEPCGAKWQFNYASFLVVDPSETVTVFMPDGRRDTFSPDGSGGYNAQKGNQNRLVKLGGDHYEMTLQDGSIAEYDIPPGSASQQSFLISLRDRHDLALLFSYDANLDLHTVTSADGVTFTLSYDGIGRITSVADPFGRAATFTYDGEALTSITDMGGYTHFFSYDADLMMTSLGNAQSQFTFGWELPDGIDNGKDPYPPPGGTMWENFRLTITDPAGHLAEYHYDGNSAFSWYVPPGNYLPYVSPGDNNLNAIKRKFEFTVNDDGRDVMSHKERLDGSSIYHTPAQVMDQNLQPVLGYLISDNHSGMYFYTRNEKGNMASWGRYLDPYEDHTLITYAGNGVDPVAVTTPDGSYQFTWTANGDMATETDRRGNTTAYTYDGLGRMVHAVDAAGTVTTFSYGSHGRLEQVTRGGSVISSYSYDSVGRILTHTTPLDRTYTLSYNPLNDITEILTPEGESVHYTYSHLWPHKVTAIHRFGKTTSYSHDVVGRVDEIGFPSGLVVTQEYDAAGHVVEIRRSDGAVTAMSFDAAGRPVEKTWPDGQTYSIDWYLDTGKPKFRVTTPRGQTFLYTMIRPLQLGHYGPFAIESVAVCEDDTCFDDPVESAGPPSKQGSFPWEQAYFLRNQYDRVEEIMHSVFDVERGEYEVKLHTFTYDANHHLAEIHDPWTKSDINLDLNAMHQLSEITVTTEDAQTFCAQYGYDAHHRLSQVSGHVANISYTYDSAFPLPDEISAPGLFDVQITRDAAGMETRIQAMNAAQESLLRMDMAYDTQNRMTELTMSPEEPIGFEEEAVTWTVNPADQLVSDNQGHAYTMDADGNLTSWPNPDHQMVQAEYDPLGRLREASYVNGTGVQVKHRFLYDYRGVLVGHQLLNNGVLAEEKRFLNLNLLPMMTFSVDRGVTADEDQFLPLAFNLFGANRGHGVGGLLAHEDLQTQQAWYPILDYSGTVRAEIDGQGQLSARRACDPYGSILGESGTSRIPFGPQGKRVFDDLGIVYYGYRFSVPHLGRWLNRDPLGEEAGFNLYQYCHGNPALYMDTDGRLPMLAVIGIGIGVGAAIELFCSVGPSIRSRRTAMGSDRRFDPLGHQDDVFGIQQNQDRIIREAANEAADKLENFMPKPGDTDAIDFAHMTYKEMKRRHPELFESAPKGGQ